MNSFFKKLFSSRKFVKTASGLKLESLNDSEVEFLEKSMSFARELIADLGLADEMEIHKPATIEKAIEAWFEKDLAKDYGINVNIFSNALATLWGDYLVKHLDMQWQVITDDYGTEVALYHPNKDTTVFPFKSTAKAFNTKDFGLLTIITEQVEVVIEK